MNKKLSFEQWVLQSKWSPYVISVLVTLIVFVAVLPLLENSRRAVLEKRISQLEEELDKKEIIYTVVSNSCQNLATMSENIQILRNMIQLDKQSLLSL